MYVITNTKLYFNLVNYLIIENIKYLFHIKNF